MSGKITCKSRDENNVLTFEYEYVGSLPRIVTFTCTGEELEAWFKGVVTIEDIMETPFKTGPGLFDKPVISFALYCMVMQLGREEPLVGATSVVSAGEKV